MFIKKGLRLIGILLLTVLLWGILPAAVMAAEPEGKFVLVAEADGELIIAPKYVSYTEEQTLGRALMNSGHDFTGLEQGIVTAIDNISGNFTRSDQNGGYDLSVSAASVTHFRFSENPDGSQPSEGLLMLMSAMADYQEKEADVQNAAKAEYTEAKKQFIGCSSDNAKLLAKDLNDAMRNYEAVLNGTKYTVRFTDGNQDYSGSNYPGMMVTARNTYGKLWTDDGDGKLELPNGDYHFCVEQNGLRVEGDITISGSQTVTAQLPTTLWLNLDEFFLSGSYGADTNVDHRFKDAQFTVGKWKDRRTTVPVMDQFVGGVYVYAQYQNLSVVPSFTAIYKMASSGWDMEDPMAFNSKTVGAMDVLGKGADGNTVIYRLSAVLEKGYTYSQDYTVDFVRTPTLSSVTVVDQKNVDQAATVKFSGSLMEYTYNVLDKVTTVTVEATPMQENYTVTVNGKNAAEGVAVPINGNTDITVAVSAGNYTNTYTLRICPGAGRSVSFLSDADVSVEVTNSNGVIMPYTTHRETNTQNRYYYTLVPGEPYSYIATRDTYYHITDTFKLEEVADSTITIDFPAGENWLKDLALGKISAKSGKGTIALNKKFSASDHLYQALYEDTGNSTYLWAATNQKDATIQAIYTQRHPYEIYHGKDKKLAVTSAIAEGKELSNILMLNNPVENELTVRVSREENGVTYYQDYVVQLKRELTLAGIAANCDGAPMTLIQENGKTGFVPSVKTYDITVSMAAQLLRLDFTRYTDNRCYGETDVGYRILVDGEDVTGSDSALIELDGSIDTQTVTVEVTNDKAPEGTGVYTLNILKAPPVEVTFLFDPADALLNISEVMSGERLWSDENGKYQLCESYSYLYTLTEYGYVGKTGTLEVTRNDQRQLVVLDGDKSYLVAESGDGGAVTISWTLPKAPVNSSIPSGMKVEWPNFRGDNTNNAVTDSQIPYAAEDGTLYWANKLGDGYGSGAVGSPILVGGDIITYAGTTIFRVDPINGEILATGTMVESSSFAITPPAYAEGMVFIALSNGCIQAFNAATLESLWVYRDPLAGQPNCPLTIEDGYLYTGFWKSETADANFVCLSITDEDPTQAYESKCSRWFHSAKGGYYWAGAYAGDGFVLVGTDDGTNFCNSNTSSLLLLNAQDGRLLDSWNGLNGDIRSTIAYDAATDAFYFTSKGGTFYSVQVAGGNTLTSMWSTSLQNGVGGIPMSTSSPVVYNGRAYVGVSGAGQFEAYSGHNITVIDLSGRRIAYSVPTQGYPQTSGLLTTAYEAQSGYVYVYFFDNYTPGKLRVLRDKPGMTKADYVTAEKNGSTAYALFTPFNDQAQYAICSPIVDEYGTIYFKNDSAYLMAFGSAVETLQITTKPTKTSYVIGDEFDPSGMVVTATYTNGKTRDVTPYVSWNQEALTANDSAITISFEYVMYHNQENGTGMDAGVVTTTPTVTLELLVTEGILGDVNNDGTVDEKDAQMILDYEAQKLDKKLNVLISDVSGDGKIDSNDAVLILQYVSGKFAEFPVEQMD